MWETEMPDSSSYSALPKTLTSRSRMGRMAGPDSSSGAASTSASKTTSALEYRRGKLGRWGGRLRTCRVRIQAAMSRVIRSEEHTSELQSLRHLVCRLLLEKKKNNYEISSHSWSPLRSGHAPALHAIN